MIIEPNNNYDNLKRFLILLRMASLRNKRKLELRETNDDLKREKSCFHSFEDYSELIFSYFSLLNLAEIFNGTRTN